LRENKGKGPVMLTDGGMQQTDGSGTANANTKSQEVNNLGEKDEAPRYDTIYQNTGWIEDPINFGFKTSYNIDIVVKNGKDTVDKKYATDGNPRKKKN